jgi:hypothetical protein
MTSPSRDIARAALANIRDLLDDSFIPPQTGNLRPIYLASPQSSFGNEITFDNLSYQLELTPNFLCWWGEPTQTRFLWRPHAEERKWPIWAGRSARRQEVFEPLDCFGETDIYISPNEFYGWRKADLLSALHAFWVEIDCRGHRTPTLLSARSILNDVLKRIELNGIAKPNLIVWSGRGWHLYWWIEPIEAKPWLVRQWRRVANELTSKIGDGTDWLCDASASHDPTRVLRLPGSIHGSTGRHVMAFETGAKRYQIDDLAFSLGIEMPLPAPVTPLVPRQDRTQELSPVKLKRSESSRSNLARWWGSVYFELRRYVHDVFNDHIPEGKRDLILHICCVAMAHWIRDDKALEKRILDLGVEITDLPPEKIQQYMSTTIRTRYHYRAETLQSLLASIGISLRAVSDAADRVHEKEGNRCDSLDEIRERQRKSAHKTALTRREGTAERIKDAITKLVADKKRVTYEAISKMAEISTRALRRLYLGDDGELRSLYLFAR